MCIYIYIYNFCFKVFLVLFFDLFWIQGTVGTLLGGQEAADEQNMNIFSNFRFFTFSICTDFSMEMYMYIFIYIYIYIYYIF